MNETKRLDVQDCNLTDNGTETLAPCSSLNLILPLSINLHVIKSMNLMHIYNLMSFKGSCFKAIFYYYNMSYDVTIKASAANSNLFKSKT